MRTQYSTYQCRYYTDVHNSSNEIFFQSRLVPNQSGISESELIDLLVTSMSKLSDEGDRRFIEAGIESECLFG